MPGMPKEAVISNPEEAKKFVEDRVAEGADYIKLVSDTPGPDQESINALVRTAHDKGKVVFAHAVNLEATRMAQMAGVDIITHAPLDGVMNDDEVRQMVENKRISVPTLIMLESVCQMKGIDQERPGFAFANALKTVMCCTMRVYLF
ncbi:amidohydrolase [Gregarina niphandrodes]|uniref:Amidohydrolase n=1 Tax=Gregarina niphandrodes TaxID=110365 RepID=A0A023AWL0_GRENI|nr:amidohydrolase [Gregarina niphandrodes]EZG42625.1 amidohydrolase [Gregarina niphandrodes]|eukprot:XP_011134775.1 amidohydrolase [Gregarina niphandrodes]